MSVQFDIPSTGYLIREATRDDAKAVRMLLGAMDRTAHDLVAVDGRQLLVIAAASATRALRRQPLPGPGVGIHVIEPCRRQGIAKKLIDRLGEIARSEAASVLYAAKRVDLNGDEMRGWKWLGFSTCETVEQHRLPLAQIEQLAPVIDRLRERGKIPAGAQIVPLYQADARAVLQLHLANLGGDRRDLSRRLRGQGADAFLPIHSRVLLIDGQVTGCLLGHRKDTDTMVVDANIVDESLRNGWATPWLRLDAAIGVKPLGIKNLEFTTFDHYADTRNFTKKHGGETVGTSVLMWRKIA